jgi:hypothetical protein
MILLSSAVALAGGGPLDVLVLFNADDPDATEVAQYYAEKRAVPANHLCGVGGVDPLTTSTSFTAYQGSIQLRLRDCLRDIPDSGDIDYIVTIRGLPYRIDIPDGYSASLEAMLQIDGAADEGVEIAGQKQASASGYFAASIENPAFVGGRLQPGDTDVTNPYSGWYGASAGLVRNDDLPWTFQRSDIGESGGVDWTAHLFVVTRLDGFDYQDAKDLVDRGVAADGTFPDAEILCMRGADDARAARDPECEFTARMLADAGLPGTWLDTHDPALSGHTVAAYFTGTADLRGAIDGQTYVPGAIADNLTSTGAYPENFFCSADGATCPASEAQTSIARFVRAGVTGVHGAVNEPLNNVFPNAGTMVLYTLGYNLGESYFFNTRYLYWQNLVLGDPLTTPYAERPSVSIPAEVPLGTPLTVTATHPDGVAETRIYVDGILRAVDDVDTVSYSLPGTVGTTHEILAIAFAAPAVVPRPGWPVDEPEPHADVQGWTKQTVTLTEPPDEDTDVPDETDGEPDTAEERGGCGCASTGTPSLGVLLALALGVTRR